MRILVTGGAGFIGSHAVRALLGRGDEVVCLDSFNDAYDPRQKELNVAPFLASQTFSLKRADILDDRIWAELATEKPFEKILHLAARAGVRPSLEHPLLYEEVNVRGTMKVLDFARAQGLPDVVAASSSSIYGAQEKVPFSENDPFPPPLSPYAASKQSMEQFCSAYHEAYGQNITCLRFFTVYGPACRPDMATSLFARKILRGETIQQFGQGESRRDYTYVSDIVDGILSALERPMNYEVINLGNGRPTALTELI
jgi:UDP-glucuronate 4-epimerase